MNAVDLRKRPGIITGTVGQEFAFCLFAKAAGIHQEEDAVHLAILQKPIDRCDGSERLACAGRHLNECAGLVVGEGSVQILNGGNLTLAKPRCIQGRKMLHVVAEGIRLFEQRREGFRPVKRKDFAGPVLDIRIIREAGQLIGGFVSKADAVFAFDPLKRAVCIPGGLLLHRGDIFSGFAFLGLDNADGHAFDEERIIHLARGGGKLAHSDAHSGHGIERFDILDDPAGLQQLSVNHLSGSLFRRHAVSPRFRRRI